MYTLPFTLIQHTPLIHFQHDQEGATLRATEVKPKLDKFLNRECEEEKIQILEQNTTNDKSLSLNYQLKIKATNIEIRDIPARFPCFFGNMGNEETGLKKFSYTTYPLTCLIQSYSKELIDIIKSKLAGFFSDHNFGMRQSKGFGSFYIAPTDSLYSEQEFYYSFFDIPYNDKEDKISNFKKIFSCIELFYKSMRGGINETSYKRDGIYMKPMIWQYYKNMNINWEKKLIKKKFAEPKLNRQADDYERSFNEKDNPVTFANENYRLIRDLFGFATDEDAWDDKYGFKIGKSHPIIERFMSPVKFKPVFINNTTCRIYLDASIIPVEIFDQSQSFIISNKKGETFSIKTPEKVFDFYAFFDFMLNDIDLEEMITNYDDRNPTVKTLTSIYTQLKNNLY